MALKELASSAHSHGPEKVLVRLPDQETPKFLGPSRVKQAAVVLFWCWAMAYMTNRINSICFRIEDDGKSILKFYWALDAYQQWMT